MVSNWNPVSLLLLLIAAATARSQEQAIDLYQRQIKPVFQERCFACHGALKQEAGLRLDTVNSMREHGILESGALLERLTSEETDVRMPPEGEPLSADERAAIAKWIESGAPAPVDEAPEADPLEHWAFGKIQRPKLPDSREANPIDAFLQRSQAAQGLKTQGVARRGLLLRRLYLDVTGLPPTAEQLRSDQPLPDLIDALLDSPQYGERWGRHWMDIWRYSDWYGLNEQLRNSQKHLWHWRDWIVESLNEDRGYDQMVQQMLAGDELAPLDRRSVVATGFLARNYYLFNRTTWLDDTIEHTSKAFLGLTMNCAKCHDHKYDPITQEDYYRLRAIFEPHHVRLDALPGETDFDRDGLPRVYDDRPDAVTYVHRRGNPAQPIEDHPVQPGVPTFLAAFTAPPSPIQLPAEAWAPGARDYVQSDLLKRAAAKVDAALVHLGELEDQADLAAAEPNDDDSGVAFNDNFKTARPEFWETIGDGWRYQGGLLAQTEPTIERSCLRTKTDHPKNFQLTLKFQTTGGQQWKSVGVRFDADQTGENAHTVYASAHGGGPKVQLSHTVAGRNIYPGDAKVDRPIELSQEYTLEVRVRGDLINVSLNDEFLFAYRLPHRRAGSIELFAFDATADFYAIDVQPLDSDVELKPTDKQVAVDPRQLVRLAEAQWKLAKAELEALKARIAADNASLKGVGNGSPELAARRQAEVVLAEAEVALLRSEPGKSVEAEKRLSQAKAQLESGEFPAYAHVRGSRRALDQGSHKASQYSPLYPKTSTGRRTALAKWMTHRDHPLTARVAVNHIWARHFGSPLVGSAFDFGRQTPEPLHRELLDYLAVELIESGWSMKHLHRLILNSKAWQRTSSNLGADPDTLKQDPENRFYWRMNSQRMESQVIRDSLLHLSGRLDSTRGGPPLKPGPDVRRRSLYLVHSRDGRDRFLSTFDDADVLNCYRRSSSIVPQQALAMMNSREAITAADQIVAGFSQTLSDDELAQAAFGLLLAREPTDEELQACLSFLKTTPQRAAFVHALLNHNDFQVIR